MSDKTREAIIIGIGIVAIFVVFGVFTHWFAANPLPYHVDWP